MAEHPIVTMPGVYDLPDEVYHADPVPGGSLSSTGARKLLPPSCPALFRYEQLHPRPPRQVFQYGHAAHRSVLGTGPDIVAVDAENWRTKAARDRAEQIRADGGVPLLAAEVAEVEAMASALRAHPIARALFDPDRGDPEQSLFWVDGPSGVWRRARLDWLPAASRGRLIVPDYKTTHDASPEAIQKAVHQYGYHQQAAWYLDGVRELGLAADAAFVFVFQQKTPPYLVTVVELDAVALRIGAERNRTAIDRYRECVETGRWPGFSDEIELIALPPWVERQHDEESV